MKTENAIRDKSFAFALRVVKCFKYLQTEHKEFILSKQFLRSGTAIAHWSGKPNKPRAKQTSFISSISR